MNLPAAGRRTQFFHLIFTEPGKRTLAHPCIVQISAKRRVQGLVNFILALAYYYCLALPAEFMQPEAHILAQPCHSYIYLTLHFARCLFGELLPPLATPDDLPLM